MVSPVLKIIEFRILPQFRLELPTQTTCCLLETQPAEKSLAMEMIVAMEIITDSYGSSCISFYSAVKPVDFVLLVSSGTRYEEHRAAFQRL